MLLKFIPYSIRLPLLIHYNYLKQSQDILINGIQNYITINYYKYNIY